MSSELSRLAFAVGIVSVSVAGFGLSQVHSGGSMARKKMPYSKISFLMNSKCVSCHNAKSHPEKVDLSSYQALMKSGEHGPIVIAGNPAKSKLIMYIDGEKQPRMPYKQPPMKSKDIQLLKSWVAAGAKG